MSTQCKAGSAVVLLRKGYVYEGRVAIDGPFAHFSGRRRVGHGESASYRPAADHTWPHAQIEAIRWLKAAA